MFNAAETVNHYLLAQHGVALEELLADAAVGLLDLKIARAGLRVACGCVYRERAEDGGTSEIHTGVLSVAGADYRFKVGLFIDLDGERFLSDIGEFEPVGWSITMRLAAGD